MATPDNTVKKINPQTAPALAKPASSEMKDQPKTKTKAETTTKTKKEPRSVRRATHKAEKANKKGGK